jgi:hypothetical protein
MDVLQVPENGFASGPCATAALPGVALPFELRMRTWSARKLRGHNDLVV